MKKHLLILLLLAFATLLRAQAPQSVTLQSVLRDAAGDLVADRTVSVRLSVLRGSATGLPVYTETHRPTTNPYGLYTVLLGQGTPTLGAFSSIDWGSGPYYLSVEADPAGGTAYTLTVSQPLVSVPYALVADTAAHVAQSASAATAQHATVADTARYFQERQVLSLGHDTIYLTGGSYVVLPPAGSSTAIYNYIDSVVNATPSVHADTAYFTLVADTARYFQERQVLTISHDTIYLTGGSFVKLPTDSVSSSMQYYIDSMVSVNNTTVVNQYIDSVINANNTTVVNQYIDSVIEANNTTVVNHYIDSVVNATPSVYADTAYYTIVADTARFFQEQQVLTISHDTIYLTGGSFVKLPAAFSGDYNDLTNQPTIPTVPTNVSAFTNDAGYLTSFTEQQVLTISNDTIYLTGGSYVKLPTAFSGDYNDLTNQPTIPTVPTNVSAFTNDAGYLTSFTEQQVLNISNDTIYLTGGSYVKLPAAFSGDYNDLSNRPSLFSGDYNDLTNQPTIPTVPTNVSAFTNDAGYLTSFTEQQVLTISNDTIYLTGGSFVKLPIDSVSPSMQYYIDSMVSVNNTTVVNHYIDSVVNANNTTVVSQYIDSVIEANNTTVVNHYIDSVVNANNTTVVNQYIDSVINANNTTVVNQYIDSVIEANNTTVVNHYIDSAVNVNNSTVVNQYIDSVFGANTTNVNHYIDSVVNANTTAIVQQVIAALPSAMCIPSCETIDSLWRALDSVVHRYDSLMAENVRRTDSLINANPPCAGRTTFGYVNASACGSYTWDITGETYTCDTTLNSQLSILNSAGCDSIVTLHLTVNTPVHGHVDVSACEHYTWTDGTGTDYTAGGTYTHSHTDGNGCTQVDTLHLTVNNPVHGHTDFSACEHYTWADGTGTDYTAGGTYTHSHTDGIGCQQVDTLHLTINHGTFDTESQTAETSYSWHGTDYTESGTYTYNYTNTDGCASVDTLHLTITGSGVVNGVLPGQFSVSATKQVKFSQGNLQYQASTGTWRFAEHQYDYEGSANSNISATYSGWIDLFCWGTSGWNSGATAYQPYSTSTTASHYMPGNSSTTDLTGSYAEADWAWHNAISNGGNSPHQWRTLTYSEWNYLINTRSNASSKWGKATVNSITGLILLPDSWTLPSGLTFTSGQSNGYTTNTYTASQWTQMEQAGAVFLPAAGRRSGTSVSSVGSNGSYWSATRSSASSARSVYFLGSSLNTGYTNSRNYGWSVRPVQDPCSGLETSGSIDVSACESYTWDVNGVTYSESATPSYTLPGANAAGCDSTVTLHLTINHGTFNAESQTTTSSYSWHGTDYTESGDYTYNYTNTDGCASVDTLHLTIVNELAPNISLVRDGCNSSSAIAITSSVPGANIYYTTNGSTPTSSSKLYTGEFSASRGTVIKAVAIKDSYQSNVAEYTVNWMCWWEFYEW